MGKHKRERSRSREKKKKKKRNRSSSPESKINKKSLKKIKKKSKKSKDSLPSIDDIISNKLKEKQLAGKGEPSVSISSDEKQKKSFIPMTKEQYDEKQSVVRKVFDEDTGRMRLVKGDGEIIEEIVSASRQKEINKAATMGDGNSFQASISAILNKK